MSFSFARSKAPAPRMPVIERESVAAQAQGEALLLVDCERHTKGWWGLLKLREGGRDRVVHVCSVLRATADAALVDAHDDAQRLAPLFVQ